MGTEGGEHLLRCPCYDTRSEYQIILQEAGLFVYRQTNRNKNDNFALPASSAEDIFILHNTKDVEILSADIVPAFAHHKISCPRCRHIIERAQKLLKSIPKINRNDIIGICDHCRRKLSHRPCDQCDQIVKKFMADRDEAKDEVNIRAQLSKTQYQQKVSLDSEHKICRQQSFTYIDIEHLHHNSAMSAREPEVADMFYSDMADRLHSVHLDIPKKQTTFIDYLGQDKYNRQRFYSKSHEDLSYTAYDIMPCRGMCPDEFRINKQITQSEESITGIRKYLTDDILTSKGKHDPASTYIPRDKKITESKYSVAKSRIPEGIIKSRPKYTDEDEIPERFMVHATHSAEGKFVLRKKRTPEDTLTPHELHKSEETLISSISGIVEGHLKKDLGYFFPHDPKKIHKKPSSLERQNVSSSELIKDTQDKFQARAKEEQLELEKKKQLKKEEQEGKRIAREEKERLKQEETKRLAREGERKRRLHEDEKKCIDEEQRKLLEKEKKQLKLGSMKKVKELSSEGNLEKVKKSISGKITGKEKTPEDSKGKELPQRKPKRVERTDGESKVSADILQEQEPKEKQKRKISEPGEKETKKEKIPKDHTTTGVGEHAEKEREPKKEKNHKEQTTPGATGPVDKEKELKKEKIQKVQSIAGVGEPINKLKDLKKEKIQKEQTTSEVKEPVDKEKETKKDKTQKERTTTQVQKPTDKEKEVKESVDKETYQKKEKPQKEQTTTEVKESVDKEKETKKAKLQTEPPTKEVKEPAGTKADSKAKGPTGADFNKLLVEQAKQEKEQDKLKKELEEQEKKAREAAEKAMKGQGTGDKTGGGIKPMRKEEPNIKKPETDKNRKGSFNFDEIDIKDIKVTNHSDDDLILSLVRLKNAAKMGDRRLTSQLNNFHRLHSHKCNAQKDEYGRCIVCTSDVQLDLESITNRQRVELKTAEIIIGSKIYKYTSPILPLADKPKKEQILPILFKTTAEDVVSLVENIPTVVTEEAEQNVSVQTKSSTAKGKPAVEPEAPKGIVRYTLSDRSFIDKGWTMLPTEKVVRKMNVYRMRPAHPEFDWFEYNKNKQLMTYDSGEKLAEFDENGRGRWYYKNGRLALDYHDAKESNAQQRFVVYSNGESDQRGRSRPFTILATFDYLGNGVVFDHSGKIRLKYNQTEGVVLDRAIGPVSHWKWHTLNDPPVLQQVMIDTQMPHKEPEIVKLGGPDDLKARPDNEEMLAIEFDNFIKEKSKKLTQKFKPFQIKMKALKINENFSLRVLDQATVYLIFRDGTANLKLNIGMILDHKEIVDTDTAEVGEVSNNLERLPARTDSLAELQRTVAMAARVERARLRRERRLRPAEPCASTERRAGAVSRPLRPALRARSDTASALDASCPCRYRKPSSSNLYYDTSLF